VVENTLPVISHIPANFAWGVNFDGHNLADGAALDEDDRRSDAPVTTATILASLDISSDKWISVCDV
jgi:hypothetical protein